MTDRSKRAFPGGGSLAVVAAVLSVLGGCFQIEPPSGLLEDGRPALAAAPDGQAAVPEGGEASSRTDWPARWGDEETGRKGVVLQLRGPVTAWRARRYGEHHRGRPTDADLEQVRRLAEGRVGPEGYRYRMERGGGYVFRRYDTGSPPRDSEALLFVSGRVAGKSLGQPLIEIERTWMELGVPDRSRFETPRGLVVISPGLFGSPRPMFRAVADALRADGWAVLRLLAPPSRYMQVRTLRLDPEDVEGSAAAAGAWFDERFAEAAYAVEAGIAHAEARVPGLADRPRALIGVSGGAISGPAVATRAAEAGRPFDAMVFVAGGSEALLITGTSTYTGLIDAVRFDWPGRRPGETLPPRELVERVSRAAVSGGHARLDPSVLAPRAAAGGAEVLVVQGASDTAVPAELGSKLWEQLGGPERWSAPLGHLGVVFKMWASIGRLVDWLDTAAPSREDGVAGGG